MPPIFDNTYEVAYIPREDNSYLYEFTNCLNVKYEVVFSLACHLMPPYSDNSNRVFDITIVSIGEPASNGKIIKDIKVSTTIAKIIYRFCTTNRFVVSYLCSNNDGKSLLRKRKFNGWFLNLGQALNFKHYATTFKNNSNNDSHVGIISTPEDEEFDYLILEIKNYYQGQYQKASE